MYDGFSNLLCIINNNNKINEDTCTCSTINAYIEKAIQFLFCSGFQLVWNWRCKGIINSQEFSLFKVFVNEMPAAHSDFEMFFSHLASYCVQMWLHLTSKTIKFCLSSWINRQLGTKSSTQLDQFRVAIPFEQYIWGKNNSKSLCVIVFLWMRISQCNELCWKFETNLLNNSFYSFIYLVVAKLKFTFCACPHRTVDMLVRHRMRGGFRPWCDSVCMQLQSGRKVFMKRL